MLRRLEREGSLRFPGPWEMRTVRSLLKRGFIKPGPRRGNAPGLWSLSAKGRRLLPRRSSEAALASSHVVPSHASTAVADMQR
ncbi:hypothetical protein FV219_01225 [Methylobacterium sp. WL122]|nr:hypothetical protein FV219_01225 [Methylobacterium sp. WL122]